MQLRLAWKSRAFALCSMFAAAIVLGACGGGGGGSGSSGPTPPPPPPPPPATCAPAGTYCIGGSLVGLQAGHSIVLQDNAGDNLTLTANGAFHFAGHLADGAAFSATISTLPAGQVCTTQYATGTVRGSDVSDIVVLCGSTVVGSFTNAAAPSIPRSLHTATRLLNGKLLVAGGMVGNTVLSTAELYDPATGQWSAAGSMINARALHTATLLANGKVLVAGGMSNNSGAIIGSAEIYDPSTNAWSLTGTMTTPRSYHAATLLQNGKVLVVGLSAFGTGQGAGAELYDPSSGKWTATGAVVNARGQETVTLLENGKVLVAGGEVYDSATNMTNISSTTEIYDPVANSWSAGASMVMPRWLHSAVMLPSGKVLVTSANSGAYGEVYDPAANSWTATGNFPAQAGGISPVWMGATTLLPSGLVLSSGGDNGGPATVSSISACWLYDPSTNQWSATGHLSTARSNHTATFLNDGSVLVVDGLSDNNQVGSAEAFR